MHRYKVDLELSDGELVQVVTILDRDGGPVVKQACRVGESPQYVADQLLWMLQRRRG